MLVYRLSLTMFAKEVTGEGARLNGGRWNKAGINCLYTAESRALSVLEYAVNVTISSIPKELSIVVLEIPDSGHLIVDNKVLPTNWNHHDVSDETQTLGTALLEKNENLVIRIPSVVIPQEYNYIINPLHPDMKKVKIVDVTAFSFDVRLKK